MFSLFSLAVPLLVQVVFSWDLTSYNLDENYYVSSIAVFKSRAFLALPRSVCHNNESGPTLVETHWAADVFHLSSTVLTGRFKIQDHQKWNQCEDIQDAISLDVHTKRHKLWILDKGNEKCQPKVVSFNLFYNIISDTTELTNIPGRYLNVITIDTKDGEYGARAYIARAENNEIVVLSLDTMTWWKIELLNPNNPLVVISPDFLAFSKTSPQLFFTSRDGYELYALNLDESEDLQSSKEAKAVLPVNVTFIGNKLGLSSGLEADFKSGLNYFMIRDYAIVRWWIGSPMEAEYHNVLAQSYEDLPYVSQLFTCPQKGIWALVNKASPEDCSASNETERALNNRVIRIMKYNKFRNDIEKEK